VACRAYGAPSVCCRFVVHLLFTDCTNPPSACGLSDGSSIKVAGFLVWKARRRCVLALPSQRRRTAVLRLILGSQGSGTAAPVERCLGRAKALASIPRSSAAATPLQRQRLARAGNHTKRHWNGVKVMDPSALKRSLTFAPRTPVGRHHNGEVTQLPAVRLLTGLPVPKDPRPGWIDSNFNFSIRRGRPSRRIFGDSKFKVCWPRQFHSN
jgi:hypothetical protein